LASNLHAGFVSALVKVVNVVFALTSCFCQLYRGVKALAQGSRPSTIGALVFVSEGDQLGLRHWNAITVMMKIATGTSTITTMS
jgi:hypothetical protein